MPTTEPSAERAGHLRRSAGGIALGAAFLLSAFNLRPAIAAVSPILPKISHADGLSHAVAGLLTSMPVLCFGVAAFFAPKLVRRGGTGRVLFVCLFALMCGIGVRSLPSLWTLFVGTFVIGVSAGVSNVLMPGVVKKDFPAHVALLTGLYTTMLNLGPSAGAGLTAPFARALGDWRLALAAWAIPVAVALVCWFPFRNHDLPVRTPEGRASPEKLRVLWRDPTAWSMSVFWGLMALNFYTVLTWLPTILQRRGVTVVGSGTLLAALNATAVGASLLIPAVGQRVGRHWMLAVASTAVDAGGTCGLLLDPHGAQLLWVMLIGLGQGACISLALMMMVLRTADSRYATALSGMSQGVGYLIAACGPVAAGALFNVSGSWRAPLLALIGLLGLQALSAWSVGRRSSKIGDVVLTRVGAGTLSTEPSAERSGREVPP